MKRLTSCCSYLPDHPRPSLIPVIHHAGLNANSRGAMQKKEAEGNSLSYHGNRGAHRIRISGANQEPFPTSNRVGHVRGVGAGSGGGRRAWGTMLCM